MIQILSIILIALSLISIFFLVKITIRRANVLNERIEEYHKEQEEQAQKPGPVNPYEELASLFDEGNVSGESEVK